MLWLDRYSLAAVIKSEPGTARLRLGAVGLAAAAGIASWLELALLWRRLRQSLPDLPGPMRGTARMTALAAIATLPAVGLWLLLPALHVALTAALVLAAYAGTYLVAAHLLGFPELAAWSGRLLRRDPGHQNTDASDDGGGGGG
jgi:peptidoglycan biosynthesis protein MviN/MurJ (putative lipid II flippase)